MISSLSVSIENYNREQVDFEIVGSKNHKEALSYIQEDGDFQSVIISWDINEDDEQDANKKKLVNAIKDIRAEIPIYIVSDDEIGMSIV